MEKKKLTECLLAASCLLQPVVKPRSFTWIRSLTNTKLDGTALFIAFETKSHHKLLRLEYMVINHAFGLIFSIVFLYAKKKPY